MAGHGSAGPARSCSALRGRRAAVLGPSPPRPWHNLELALTYLIFLAACHPDRAVAVLRVACRLVRIYTDASWATNVL